MARGKKRAVSSDVEVRDHRPGERSRTLSCMRTPSFTFAKSILQLSGAHGYATCTQSASCAPDNARVVRGDGTETGAGREDIGIDADDADDEAEAPQGGTIYIQALRRYVGLFSARAHAN